MSKVTEMRRPSILFINRVFAPDEGATGLMIGQLAKLLHSDGFLTTVVCAKTVANTLSEECVDGIRVARARTLPFTKKSNILRALSYLSVYPALIWKSLRQTKPDILVTKTDPPLILVAGALLNLWWRVPIIHWAQDLYPELAEEMGILTKNGWFARMLRSISSFALKRYDAVIAIGRCMEKRLIDRGVDANKIHVITNWQDIDAIQPMTHAENRFRTIHDLENKSVVMYSGNFALYYPFEEIVDAAVHFDASRDDVRFVFIGHGRKLSWLKEEVEKRGLRNVQFLPYQPFSELSESLGAADIHLVCMDSRIAGIVVPSKIYGVLAAGRPALFMGPRSSEAAMLIEEYQCGAIIDANEEGELISCLEAWLGDEELRKLAGKRARKAAESVSLDLASKKFAQLFRSLLGHSGEIRKVPEN